MLHKRHQFLHIGLELRDGLENFQHLLVGREGIIYLQGNVRWEEGKKSIGKEGGERKRWGKERKLKYSDRSNVCYGTNRSKTR